MEMMGRPQIILSNERVASLRSSLRIGDVIEGKVIARVGQDRYVITFLGQDLIAHYAGFLRRGAIVQTIVQQTAPQVVFKILTGYALPSELHAHEENLKTMIRQYGGRVRLRPHCAELLDDLTEALRAFGRARGDKDEGHVLLKPVLPWVRELSLTAKRATAAAAGHYGIARKELALASLERSFKNIDAFVMKASEGRYDPAIEAVGEVGEGLKKLYLNLRLERAVNTVTALPEKGITFLQIALQESGGGHRPVDCYYREDNAAAWAAQLIMEKQGTVTHGDVLYERPQQRLVFSRDAAAWLPRDHMHALTTSGITVTEHTRATAAGVIGDEEVPVIDLLKPARFDLVV